MDRAELRRTISIELQEPFFLDMTSGFGTKAGGSHPIPVELWDKTNKLARSWIYFLTGANAFVERRILNYNSQTGVITTEPALGGSWVASDRFEIHARYS